MVRRISVEETRGGLMYLVTWQSKDGRPSQEYFDTFDLAKKQSDWLIRLGRSPKIWADVTDSPNE